jgi:hypothetical protein
MKPVTQLRMVGDEEFDGLLSRRTADIKVLAKAVRDLVREGGQMWLK